MASTTWDLLRGTAYLRTAWTRLLQKQVLDPTGWRARPRVLLSLNSSLQRLREGAMHDHVATGPGNLYLRHRVPLSLNSSLSRLREGAMHEHGM